ncbi:nucleotidyltransferase family protein [Candidatus Woesearchaeota archaeon]|jgi:NDP-sugar pyrophosphorylase family protein|nr:nucleotidyltransferase family protein [Candidatus Woesearchaeota archaeon]MBT5739866.1 nucleotidyltransferase family protein [Candidatus Woesearchaeota archaeon]
MKKAVILAAGRGSRFKEFTEDTPKALINFRGKPLIEHVLRMITDSDIKDVAIVVGYKGDQIKEYVGSGEKFNLKVSYYTQEIQDGMLSAILTTKSWVGDNHFLVTCCDVVYPGSLLPLVKKHQSENAKATISVVLQPEPVSKAIVCVNNNKVISIHSSSKDYTSIFTDAGMMCFSPRIFQFLEEEKNYLSAITRLIKNEYVIAHQLEAPCYNVNSVEDLEKAE